MLVGVVRTVGSPCRCAESVSAGLEALGHQILTADSEEIEARAPELARRCDLVIDHTDTYRGRGSYRPLVRLTLENWGARIVGSPSEACFLADNKAAARERLAAAGVPVPPGIVVRSPDCEIPDWLRPPFVVKPAFEHMSRGLRLAQTAQEARRAAHELLQSALQPVLVESYIAGRELAVTLLAPPDRLEVLPVLEWNLPAGREDILTESMKLIDPSGMKQRVVQPSLPGHVSEELQDLARQAFRALGLRDYARFDVRLSPAGNAYFLEANTTPSLEPLEALAVSAGWAGMSYSEMVDRLLSAAASRYEPARPRTRHLALRSHTIELEVPPGVHVPPQSTIDLAELLDARQGDEALELGCGSGLLSITMAKLGAGRVIATDLDPLALRATAENARRNGVADRIWTRAGCWFDVLDESERFDLIVATPPQTPGPEAIGPRYGGPDGARHLINVIRNAPRFLKPGGRLWLLALSLANPRRVESELREQFSDVLRARETERPFTLDEYDAIYKGLSGHLLSLRASGSAEFTGEREGQYSFRNIFWRASGPRNL